MADEFIYDSGKCRVCGEYSDELLDYMCPTCYKEYMIDTGIAGSDEDDE